MTPNTHSYTLLAAFFAVTVGAAAINVTLSLPPGTSNHGDPNLICTPVSWIDIITFFLGKYSLIVNAIAALLFPAYGLFRGITLIMTFAVFGKTEQEKALRAQALFMVVRSKEWMPMADEKIKHLILKTNGSKVLDAAVDEAPRDLHVCVYDPPWMTNIMGLGSERLSETPGDELHGNNEIPAGYEYATAPKEATVEPLPANEATCTILKNYNLLKSVIALGQALYGISTLYQAPGDQILEYGYVAFSLTVAPYATMSVVNLIAALFYPDYPEAYLVETSILVEARSRGGKFHGVVGRLVEAESALEVWEDDGSFHVVREVAFGKGTDKASGSYLQVHLTTRQSNAQLSESKTMRVLKEVSLRESENPPSAKSRGTLNELSTFELRERRIGFDYNKINTPTLLVPACSPFKASKATTGESKATSYFVKAAEWKPSSESWDVDFKGSVGSNTLRGVIGLLLTLSVAGVPFVIIGGLSHYQHGKSTLAQRVWITAWLSVGLGYLIIAVVLNGLLFPLRRCMPERRVQVIQEVPRFLLMGTPSVGGFVVVVQMLRAYGSCLTIP